MDAATLLAARQQTLDAVLMRLHALEQERQSLVNQAAHLQGGIAALQELVDAEASRTVQDAPGERDVSPGDPAPVLAPALPWERS